MKHKLDFSLKTSLLFLALVLAISITASYYDTTNARGECAEKIYIGIGETYQITKKHGGVKSYDDRIVSSRYNGTITAENMGTARIRISGKLYDVEVLNAPESVKTDDLKIGVNEVALPNSTVNDGSCSHSYTYKSSDESIVALSKDGKLVGVSKGTAKVSAIAYNGVSADFSVDVLNEPDEVSFKYKEIEMFTGASDNSVVSFGNGYSSSNAFASSNTSVLAVDEKTGKIHALAEGTATVSVKTYNGKTAECNIIVCEKPYDIRTDLDPNKPMIAFTFDDGPNASSTGRILDALQKYNASATFFIVGNRISWSGNKKIVNQMVDMGCQLGNHTYNHEHYGDEVNKDDIIKNISAICDATGMEPSAFRPTGGEITNDIKENASAPIILWSIDTDDWKHRNADKTFEYVMKYAHDGDIILMHDIYDQTADAVEKLLPELQKYNYQVVNVAELAYYKGVVLKDGEIYHSMK